MSTPEIHLHGGEVDTHFHALHILAREIDVSQLLADSFAAGLSAAVDIGTEESDIARRVELLGTVSGVRFAHGLYPSNADREDIDGALEVVEAALSDDRVCAVGEIGIDRYRDYATPHAQRELFARQVELANRHDLPVVVHNRDAEEDLLDALSACAPHRESVMHCYSGPAEYVTRFLDLGFSMSFGGNSTFRNAESIREAMRLVPTDRLLLETDAPYLAPHPRRGRTNHPGLIGYTYEAAAQSVGIDREKLTGIVAANAARVLFFRRAER